MKHTSETLLTNCAQTLKYLLDTEHTLKNEVNVEFSKLLDDFKSKLSEEEDSDVIALTLKRLNYLYGIANVPHYVDLYEDVVRFMELQYSNEVGTVQFHFNSQVIMESMQIVMNHILWRFSDIDPERPTLDAIDRVAILRNSFFAKLEGFFQTEDIAVEVQDKVSS